MSEPTKTPFDLIVDQIRAVVREEIAKLRATSKLEDRLLDTDEAMKVLGYHEDQRQSFNRNREIRKCRRKVGGFYRYSSSALQRYIESLDESHRFTVLKSVKNA